ncbi:52 kDa repressor of the inhibitor of the protein kinase-like [Callorhinchus milii]|uniref:52 kDa repressor of the inhibitor of the protein kinase-like n=1 Tax=Callorhinchus milii TaxID=7868 RepID=UPI00045757B6|nr:52 kDa repressor of the inhibitor of the protein kinase-like [Callorhinchus milii]|eukprot:gi/632947811/ref/XP_007889251.1/ PREDICTED: 52 kDa repressor of the inhibitor of the protein kinase-like [Callorhinchus milii]
MPNACAAPSCRRRSTRCRGLAFYRFPRDPARCRQWVDNCQRPDLRAKSPEQLHHQHRLCALHFTRDLLQCPRRSLLRPDAVPTLFDLPPSPPKKPDSSHRKHKRRWLSEAQLREVMALRATSASQPGRAPPGPASPGGRGGSEGLPLSAAAAAASARPARDPPKDERPGSGGAAAPEDAGSPGTASGFMFQGFWIKISQRKGTS